MISRSHRMLPIQHTTYTRHVHPCPLRDSNLSSQQLRGYRPAVRLHGHRDQQWHLISTLFSWPLTNMWTENSLRNDQFFPLVSLKVSWRDSWIFHTLWMYDLFDTVFVVSVNLLKPTGYVMHQQFNMQQLYVLPTLYLCVLYLSENKQRLVPLTA